MASTTDDDAKKQQEFFPSIGQHVESGQEESDDVRGVEQIESLCMRCHEQGETRMLLTSIPYFHEVIVMSFRCEHCGFSNNEIQSAGVVRPSGVHYTLSLLPSTSEDLDRQLIRSPSCTISVPELTLTLPSLPSTKGQLTTVEGLLKDIIRDLKGDQPLRKIMDDNAFDIVNNILGSLRKVVGDEDLEDDEEKPPEPTNVPDKLTLVVDDPSGNSFVEFLGSMNDPKWSLKTYERTREQNVSLGLSVPEEEDKEKLEEVKEDEELTNDEVLVFDGVCSSCGVASETKMKRVDIPHFQEIIIMSTNCTHCGYRDNEVKSGSSISKLGKKIILKVEDEDDLARDILKSETSGLSIPELQLELTHGTLGGRFTTIEGILEQVHEELSTKMKSIYDGDSKTGGTQTEEDKEDKQTFTQFLEKLRSFKALEETFTLILDDPLSNSYIQNLYAPDPDPNMQVEEYERTWEQNEELGLNDIKVEGYEEDAEKKEVEGVEKGIEKLGVAETEDKDSGLANS